MFLRIEEPLCPTFAFINTGFHLLFSTNRSVTRTTGRTWILLSPRAGRHPPSHRGRDGTEQAYRNPAGRDSSPRLTALPTSPPGAPTEERREEDGERAAPPLAPLTQAHEQHRLHFSRRHLRPEPSHLKEGTFPAVAQLEPRFTAPAVAAGYIFCLI